MTAIRLAQFLGANQALERMLLPDGVGVVSINQKPGRGDLRPWHPPSQVATAVAGAVSIYRMGRDTPSDTSTWVSWPFDGHAARTYDINDTSERTYYSGDTYPKVMDNGTITTPADPNAGKYRIYLYSTTLGFLPAGYNVKLSVSGMADQTFVMQPATGNSTLQQVLVSEFNALSGVTATALSSSDTLAPGGVQITGNTVGVPFSVSYQDPTSKNWVQILTSFLYNPTYNAANLRPLGLPAPIAAPAVTPNLQPTDANTGKYQMYFYSSDIAQYTVGQVMNVQVHGNADVQITLAAGTGSTLVTATSLVAALASVTGIASSVLAADDDTAPNGVLVWSSSPGVTFDIQTSTGTTSNYATSAVTYTTLATATGAAGSNSQTLLSVAASSVNGYQSSPLSAYQAFVPQSSLSGIQAGDTIVVSVGGTQRVSFVAPQAYSPAVAWLSVFGAASSLTYVAVPASGDSQDGNYQPAGIAFTLGSVSSGATVLVTRNGAVSASTTITQATINTWGATSGDEWQITVGSNAPQQITLYYDSSTYPQIVTPHVLYQLINGIINNLTIVESTVNGVDQVVLTATMSGASTTLTIKKIVPGTTQNWVTAKTANLYDPAAPTLLDFYYVYTFVNDWGWESAPSPVSSVVSKQQTDTAILNSFSTPPTGYYVQSIRIYRTQASASGSGGFYFIAEMPVTSPAMMDDGQSIGEALATSTWVPAPGIAWGGSTNYTEPEALQVLTPMWNGMIAGICGKSVRVCESYVPYAWPTTYSVVPPDGTPVGLGVFGQSMIVLTTSFPIIVSGSTPDALDIAPVASRYSCLSEKSIVSTGSGVLWASPEGLCMYGPGGVTNITDSLMLREDWQALNPSSMVASTYMDMYVCSYTPVGSSTSLGFILDPRNPKGLYFLSFGFQYGYFDTLTNALYLLQGTQIMKWDAGTTFLTATFETGVQRMQKPTNFARGKVVAESFPVALQVSAGPFSSTELAAVLAANANLSAGSDGASVVYSVQVNDREMFPLPSGFLATDWQVQVSTTSTQASPAIQALAIATSTEELRQI